MSVTKRAYKILDSTLKEWEYEQIKEETLVIDTELIPLIDNSKSVPVEVYTGETLNINPNLKAGELKHLVTLLKQHKGAFAWEYKGMRGIPLALCTHHIYIKNY